MTSFFFFIAGIVWLLTVYDIQYRIAIGNQTMADRLEVPEDLRCAEGCVNGIIILFAAVVLIATAVYMIYHT